MFQCVQINLCIVLLLFISCTNGDSGFGWNAKRLHTKDNLNNSTADRPVISIEDGLLQGFTRTTIGGRKIVSFRAIPYGLPPIGPLRFQPPQPSLPWTGIRDASVETNECTQIVQYGEVTGPSTIRGSEDCLYIEVHVPQSALEGASSSNTSKPLPVIVYIHGGSFIHGSGSMYGPYYLLDQNVILVTINYRLGAFGFLSTGTSAAYGNAGLKDQVLALKWVQENIRSFGGSEQSITIAGESAGGISVNHHVLSPASRGLFHRAISQSGTSTCWWGTEKNVPQLAYKTGSLFGCHGNPDQLVKCLQKVPADQLVTAPVRVRDWTSRFPLITYYPVVEPEHSGAFLSQQPEEIYKQRKHANVPFLTGFTKNEMSWFFANFIQNKSAIQQLNSNWDEYGAIFLSIGNSTNAKSKSGIATKIRDFYLGKRNMEINFENRFEIIDMLSDQFVQNCALDTMYLHAKYTSQPVYGYQFSFEGKYSLVQQYGQNPKDWGVSHVDDLIYLFNNTAYYPQIKKATDKMEYKMAEIMTSTWANFATFGIPYVGGSGASKSNRESKMIWKPIQINSGNRRRTRAGYDVSSFQFLDLNLTPRMIKNPFVERYEFWNSLPI